MRSAIKTFVAGDNQNPDTSEHRSYLIRSRQRSILLILPAFRQAMSFSFKDKLCIGKKKTWCVRRNMATNHRPVSMQEVNFICLVMPWFCLPLKKMHFRANYCRCLSVAPLHRGGEKEDLTLNFSHPHLPRNTEAQQWHDDLCRTFGGPRGGWAGGGRGGPLRGAKQKVLVGGRKGRLAGHGIEGLRRVGQLTGSGIGGLGGGRGGGVGESGKFKYSRLVKDEGNTPPELKWRLSAPLYLHGKEKSGNGFHKTNYIAMINYIVMINYIRINYIAFGQVHQTNQHNSDTHWNETSVKDTSFAHWLP